MEVEGSWLEAGLGKSVRPYLKNKKKSKTSWVWWYTPVIPSWGGGRGGRITV
jgi:hypothetical protein